MARLWQRHPRYTTLIALAFIATFYLLVPYGSVPRRPYDPSLASRLDHSNYIYDNMVKKRQGLIKKFGPKPKDVILFPPDLPPWPPYTVWDFFPAAFTCPHEIHRLGALGDGGKWVCGITRVAEKKDCVVYSFGINNESSFEAEILENTEYCEIWGYDFSVESFGPEISASSQHRVHFKAVGLAGADSPEDNPPMYTLESLMQKNGHTHIDILKIDIESWEFDTLTTLIKPYIESGKPLPFGQLQLEVHIWDRGFEVYLAWWEMLEEAGLRPFWTEPNLVYQNYNKKHSSDLAEYSFLNIKGDNVFIKNHEPSGGKHPHGPRHE